MRPGFNAVRSLKAPTCPARRLRLRHLATRAFAVAALACLILPLMACPEKQAKSTTTDYDKVEGGLRLAINVTQVSYNSWNKVYERFMELHRGGKLSEARWASVSAIDGVIVLSEADLIEGIERSKKFLEGLRQASAKVLSAESADEVSQLRERESEARSKFNASVDYLQRKSIKLRDSYVEAVIVAEAVIKDGHALPADHLATIRQTIKLIDQEVVRERLKDKNRGGEPGAEKAESPLANAPR